VNVLGIKNTLPDVIAAVPLISEVKEGFLAQQVYEVAILQAEEHFEVVEVCFVLNQFTHHVDHLHYTCARRVKVFLVDCNVVVCLVCLIFDLYDRLILHDVELLLVLLDLVLEGLPQAFTDKQLTGEGLDALLSL